LPNQCENHRLFGYFKVFMKIAVIGAGIIGIATAYELAQDGHKVTVYDSKAAAAEGASFANTGVIAPSRTLPLSLPDWSQPSVWHFLRSVRNISLKKGISAQDIRWLWRWGHSSGALEDASALSAMYALSAYSQQRMDDITGDAGLEFEGSEGHLLVFPTEASAKQYQPTLAILKSHGVALKELNATELTAIDPALSSSGTLHGGIHLPNDSVGNCRQFGLLLKLEAQKLGTQFVFNGAIEEIQTDSAITLIPKDRSAARTFDGVVLCTGDIPTFLRQRIHAKVPTANVYGYSLSASIREPLNAPRSVVTDVASQIVIARIGNRVRVSGGAELGADAEYKNPTVVQSLFKALHHYFPGAVHHPMGTQIWKSARTMTADGLPFIGATNLPKVWLNLAHGADGWGTACGSARLLADLVGNKTPDMDAAAFNPARTPNKKFV
jgi:D-amino-acid dehydrogenase